MDILHVVQTHERLDLALALAYVRAAGIPLFESELRALANLEALDDPRAMQRLVAELEPDARVLLDAIIARLA
jgi:glyoxylase-like metal-dependent hydrolase (beta-lactamase superfamily II)